MEPEEIVKAVFLLILLGLVVAWMVVLTLSLFIEEYRAYIIVSTPFMAILCLWACRRLEEQSRERR